MQAYYEHVFSQQLLASLKCLESTTWSIEHMQKVGLFAQAEQGQTSLLLALLHMVEYSGSITIDGREIRTVPRDVLRSRITTITQHSFELRGSVRNNLDPFSIIRPYFSDVDLVTMLQRVHLWRTVSDRGGLDADISSMRFTSAQMQLLSLARGALHRRRANTKIVLIDKATSDLADNVDWEMQDFLDGEFATCTVITVADRLSIIHTADVVMAMQAGHVGAVVEVDYLANTS
ncbi:hypothetical protein NLG97_g4686 [Lecanicillium saksenae]|uniref:Uncharacterized protein n=1 Tax=Lecanicillium saksenae TaxID=468837 RepID=A0ACC1QUK1_9HYPO|nr:hypothetical protein NLG97_g4686 [Lecanicillium saksenae]